MKKINDIIRDKRGSSFPLIAAAVLTVILIMCGLSEYIRLLIISQGVRDALQSAVISTINENYDNVYNCIREGYAGAYMPNGTEWADSTDYGDIYSRLDKALGLKSENGFHVKYSGKKQEFILSGLSLDINNPPIAPYEKFNTNSLLANAEIKLEVPVSFAGKALLPLQIKLRVQARYMPMF
ncbi:hypothetical protein Cpap_0156 [Ruminiclostridium papyrosolvens DSM 2782]|uniref:Uncharacterized protein n=1 Tax=Ruminiclostridium papyrosolvens DSM 2782 TaxID=588581 RepID=F1TIH2_9FIRM|nr:hypothetical protein Cpap_0156 [Ruminiclostridium papyrosolvens DSM 2782]